MLGMMCVNAGHAVHQWWACCVTGHGVVRQPKVDSSFGSAHRASISFERTHKRLLKGASLYFGVATSEMCAELIADLNGAFCVF